MQVLAACHVHSSWSYDGSWSLAALGSKFKKQGCRVVLMTEHDRGFNEQRFAEYRNACSKASTDLLMVPGIEYSDPNNCVHILVWGAPFLGEGLATADMLKAAREVNAVPVLAHPSRKNAWEHFDHWGKQLLGVELWNRKYDGWAPSRSAPDLLRKGTQLPFVGLDFHSNRQSFPLAMALDLPSDDLSEETVLQSLRSGHCSPRAFGVPLSHLLLRRSFPALALAERGRRRASSILKRSRAGKN